MKNSSKLIAVASILLVSCLPSSAQMTQKRAANQSAPTSLEWAVTEDYGYTLKGYPIENMMDGKATTTWAGSLDSVDDDGTKYFDDSKVYGDGLLGFKIEVKGQQVNYLTIIAGYAKSSTAFNNNSAPTQIAIYDGRYEMNDGGEFVDSEGNPVEPIATQNLKRTMQPQRVDFNLDLDGAGTLWFAIYDVEQGAKYNDLCISELAFYGRK